MSNKQLNIKGAADQKERRELSCGEYVFVVCGVCTVPSGISTSSHKHFLFVLNGMEWDAFSWNAAEWELQVILSQHKLCEECSVLSRKVHP